MSGGSSANNSWTILTPEETAAETLRPLAEGKEHHEETLTSAAGSGENQPASGAESAEGLPVQGHLVSEEKTAELSGDTSTGQHASVPSAITNAPVPTTLEVSSSFVPGTDALSQSQGLPEGPAQPSPDPDSFSDSYTHITPSPDEPPASLLSTETLGGVEFTEEEEGLKQEGQLHPLHEEELQQEVEESDLSQRTTDVGKQAVYLVDQLVMELFCIWARRLSGEVVVDSPVDLEVGEERTEKTGEEGEPEVRRRRSLLAALERIGRTDEEEEGEEEFQLPQREDDSGFSVNKCILGAVILLGLGTIFFSGVFMDLNEESDYGTMEVQDAELPVKQEWLNPEVPPPPVDADSTELLNKLVKGNQQISVLQAQLQAQKEELKVAEGQAAEGAKERLQWEEVEKENTASEAVQAPVKPTTLPPSGQPEDSTQATAGSAERQPRKPDQKEKKKDVKMDKKDMGEKKEGKVRDTSEWKEGEKKERKDGGKTEWKKGKHEQGKFDKEKDKEGKQKKHSDETKQWKDKEWKKEKASRGDEGKPWKEREGKKDRIEKSERKELKEEKGWKKSQHEKVNEGKQWRGKEEKKDWKVGKDHGEKHVGREWKGEREWKKGKDGNQESGKEKWEKKDWKEKGEKKEWKKDHEWKSEKSKDHSKEGKGRGEKKQWKESENHGKERKGKDERKPGKENGWKSKNGKDDKEWKNMDERKQWEKKEGGQKEKKLNGDWNKDRSSSPKHKDEDKFTGNHEHKQEHLWGDKNPPHAHRRPSMEQPEYWVQQRDRLQHNPKPPQHCNSLETCAKTEGLLPVPFPEFEAILQTYLAKAEEVGVDASKIEELKKLANEFFKDGVFVHDKMSFQDFVEDLGDVLEDMVEGDSDDEEEDSALEEEMEGFEKDVMKRFSLPGAREKEERSKGEWRKESGRARG
ncbi:pre-B-cell leukemia homeobox interacting protein 1b isoform X5 [Dicentrarchus labrax]|uniref:pre-B-cell leukemia homeobox interacting protein 1b isoform X5 n=1 Tax=Dicentrarchus labrax TaxID=13489 RepID=UPI0021F66C07|nr:pre-B-cell leukemia homeobox interacting protein 1b isoform X5 [Dicentrarchus labrax]